MYTLCMTESFFSSGPKYSNIFAKSSICTVSPFAAFEISRTREEKEGGRRGERGKGGETNLQQI